MISIILLALLILTVFVFILGILKKKKIMTIFSLIIGVALIVFIYLIGQALKTM